MTSDGWWGSTEGSAEDGAATGMDFLFREDDVGSQRMLALLRDPDVHDIRCNRHDRIFYSDASGSKMVNQVFAGPSQYEAFIDSLLLLTDVGFERLRDANCPFLEGSFRSDATDIKGSVIIANRDVMREEPAVVIRKQPSGLVTLDRMLEQGMMSTDMRLFLELAVRGRLNILLSGGSGAGKTTLARALSWYVDPSQRLVTVEEIDELHLDDRLPNVVAMTTFRERDARGVLIREESLDDLVKHALRMRPDRIWVGEVRGREAYALVKACLSGHDGSVTTIHANNTHQATRQLVSYVMEASLPEEVARDQVTAAFHIAVHVRQGKLGRRVVTEIVELEQVREGSEQRRNELWRYDLLSDSFVRVGQPSPRLRAALEEHNVNLRDLDVLVGVR